MSATTTPERETIPGDNCRRCDFGNYTTHAGDCDICGEVGGSYLPLGRIADLLLDYIADDLSHGKRPLVWWFELSDEDRERFHEDARGAVRRFLEREKLGRKVVAAGSKEVQP